ncbi:MULTISPECIES: hypothetical protein [unclassified Janthinobacterium]|uniref:hypothetical protein n=1 Tax=unclassified Janthinobacterium TaxID=2610881 RepID=UPI00034927A5|nr:MULTISPECIES: hypothetical protein [unclassified Janthinobacterium]MEC5161713.1 hypothetical protein [Janthinobacterium sp. CG_S6]
MSKYALAVIPALVDPVTGALVGLLGRDGREYALPFAVMNSAGLQGTMQITAGATNIAGALTVTLGGAPATLTNPIVQTTHSVNDYTQVSTQNKSATANASADHICYPDNVTASDLTGFVDIGITSSAFAQAAYAITGPNEAYLFGSAPSGAGKTGDMVIATDSTGSSNAIWFGTGGFGAIANRRAGFVGANLRPYTNGSCGLGDANVGFTKLYVDYTNTATVGAVTINKAAGRVNIAAGATTVTVTNSYCTAAAHVFAVISSSDPSCYLKNVIPAAGSFTINVYNATTVNTSVDFFIINAD